MQEYQYSAMFYDPLLSPLICPIRHKITAIAKQNQYNRILDVCCGTGEQLKMLGREGIRGEGIDLSNAMLKVARKGPISAECQWGDAAEMAYGDQSFDLVTTTFALHEKEWQTARKIIEEMVRLTAVGGDILIVDYELSRKTSILSKSLIYLIEKFAGGDHYRNFKTYLQKGGLPDLLEGLPLQEIRRYYFGRYGIVMLLLQKV